MAPFWLRFRLMQELYIVGFLAHLSGRLIGELIVYQWLRRPSGVRKHFQTSSPLKLPGQLNSYFIWRLLRMGERKFVQMVLVTWPRWPPHPYMVKNLQKSSSLEPEGQWPWDLVCSIGVVGPTKFVQMMILGWPWPTYRQGQICFLLHLNGKISEKLIFWKMWKL